MCFLSLKFIAVPYNLILLLRAYFIKRCLHAGYTVLTADIDAVWKANPLEEFQLPQYASADIMAPRDTPHDETLVHDILQFYESVDL